MSPGIYVTSYRKAFAALLLFSSSIQFVVQASMNSMKEEHALKPY